jgi:hypothetical protein
MSDELFLFVMQEFSAPMTRVLLGLKHSWVLFPPVGRYLQLSG